MHLAEAADKRQVRSRLPAYLCRYPNHSPHNILDQLQTHFESFEVPTIHEHVLYTIQSANNVFNSFQTPQTALVHASLSLALDMTGHLQSSAFHRSKSSSPARSSRTQRRCSLRGQRRPAIRPPRRRCPAVVMQLLPHGAGSILWRRTPRPKQAEAVAARAQRRSGLRPETAGQHMEQAGPSCPISATACRAAHGQQCCGVEPHFRRCSCESSLGATLPG